MVDGVRKAGFKSSACAFIVGLISLFIFPLFLLFLLVWVSVNWASGTDMQNRMISCNSAAALAWGSELRLETLCGSPTEGHHILDIHPIRGQCEGLVLKWWRLSIVASQTSGAKINGLHCFTRKCRLLCWCCRSPLFCPVLYFGRRLTIKELSPQARYTCVQMFVED